MELYSKEELLKELKKEYSCGGECDHCPEVLDAGSCSVLRCIRRIIDNVTPVDISGSEYFPYRTAFFNGVEAAKRGEWIPVSERLPEEKINPYTLDFEYVLCSTIWDDIRPYKYGKSKGDDKAHFWYGGRIMDEAVIAWQPLPEPYKKGGTE